MITKRTNRIFSLLIVFLTLTLFFMGCAGQEEDQEQSFLNETEKVSQTAQENLTDVSLGEMSEGYTGEKIIQVIEGSGGTTIAVDAQVDADGIDEVSCYRFVPEQITEEIRERLLREKHRAETWDVMEAAVYNPEKGAWEFVTPIGGEWIYQVTHSGIPGEDVLDHENTAADISYDIKQIFPVATPKDVEDTLLMEVTDAVPSEIEVLGMYDINAIDPDGSYSCSYIHVCEAADGQFYAKAVFRKMIDGMPVTAWHDFTTVTKKGSLFPAKIWGSFFSEEEIGLDAPILSVNEAVAALQGQIDLIPVQEVQLSVTKISLEYLSVISSEGEMLIVPVWRFWAGDDEAERCKRSEEIIAVNAVSGELIWEIRKAFVDQ